MLLRRPQSLPRVTVGRPARRPARRLGLAPRVPLRLADPCATVMCHRRWQAIMKEKSEVEDIEKNVERKMLKHFDEKVEKNIDETFPKKMLNLTFYLNKCSYNSMLVQHFG
jgi:hypothetical protein